MFSSALPTRACVAYVGSVMRHLPPVVLFMSAFANEPHIYFRLILLLVFLSQVQHHVVHSLRFLCGGPHCPAEADEFRWGWEFHLEGASAFIKVNVTLEDLAFSFPGCHFCW